MEAHHTSADGNAVYRFEITYEYAGERGAVEKETVQDELSESAARQLAGHAALDRGADIHEFDAHDVTVLDVTRLDDAA
ncbi:uncharacterized protein ChaoS9_225 [Halobacterium phage ChaoS9]|uniref:Uncharacterized protein n=1 Tax=Halobacterium phage ChaoS9 TaxID=2847105 RepID=A0A481V9U5_9CAUD|nr:uncharacterized protein KMC41_gp46 [Halobacterium phage ChaoS9]QBI90050.1 uncharacterized protein ChaoS9_225 [Halobacterium phage ChaoS9]